MTLIERPWFREWQAEQIEARDARGYNTDASARVCDQLDGVEAMWERYPDFSIVGYEGEIYRCQTFHQFYTGLAGYWSCGYSYFPYGWRGQDDVLHICRKLKIPDLETALLEGRERLRPFSDYDLDLYDAWLKRGAMRGTGQVIEEESELWNKIYGVLEVYYLNWWQEKDRFHKLDVFGPFDDPSQASHHYEGDPVLVALAQYVDAIIEEHPMIVQDLGPAETAPVPTRIENPNTHMVQCAEWLISESKNLFEFFNRNGLWLKERLPIYGSFVGGERLEDDTPHDKRKFWANLYTTKKDQDIVVAAFRDGYLIIDVDSWTEIGRVMEAPGRYQDHRKKYKSINDKIQFNVDLEERKIKFGRFLSPLPRKLIYRG